VPGPGRVRRVRRAIAAAVTLLALAVTGSDLRTPAAPARPEPVAAPQSGTVRALTYNLCGANPPCRSGLTVADWTTVLQRAVLGWDADVVLLQEVCFGQWAALGPALPGYRGVWLATVTAPGCAKWDPGGDTRFGLAVFARTGAVQPLAADLAVPAGKEPRAVLCARAVTRERPLLACSTHLAGYIRPDNGAGQMMTWVNEWAAGLPVVLGGDLNAPPGSPVLDPILAGWPGSGGLVEVDATDPAYFTPDCRRSGASRCRSGEPTVRIGDASRKFDDIFVTGSDLEPLCADVVDPGLSDHRLLRAVARFRSR
jgi:endonuclease/exonuclease/phosphatase family metal-dependent hydrolase